MFDPFAYHRRLVAAAFGIAATAQRASEMASASQDVIARRSEIMAHAARSPLTGNYAELGRMAPEKLEAFSSAVAAVAQDYWEIQASIIKESRYFWRQTMNGRAPTTTELSAMVSRAVEFPLRTLERLSAMGDAGLDPIHATATANAKRLKLTSRSMRA
jgi:hypothetical protein